MLIQFIRKLVNVEALKRKLENEEDEVIAYSDLLEAVKSMGVGRSKDEVAPFARQGRGRSLIQKKLLIICSPSLGYCSYFGKKLDPEPGRCRRTDGKKWRCAKDAYPDSKYCKRHMHRSKNRSRKPVESQTLSRSQFSSSSSTVTSLTRTTLSTKGSYQNNSTQHSTAAGGIITSSNLSPYGTASKDYRYLHGGKGGVDEHSYFSKTSGSARGVRLDSSPDSSWPSLLSSRASFFPISEAGDTSLVPYPQLHCLQDLGQQQKQHSFIGDDFGVSAEPVKQDSHSLRPFFDEWPKASDSWPRLEDDRSSFSTTQLSISIPLAASDSSATASHNGD